MKKLGGIANGGGWRVHGRSEAVRGRGIGYDYVHVAVDDHSRLAYVEVLPDEKGQTCAQFLTNAAAFMAGHGAPVPEVMTDNALADIRSADFAKAITDLGAKHRRAKPRSPWQNGKAERFNRTQKGLDFGHEGMRVLGEEREDQTEADSGFRVAALAGLAVGAGNDAVNQILTVSVSPASTHAGRATRRRPRPMRSSSWC